MSRISAMLLASIAAVAQGEERFPPPEFRSGYVIPAEQYPAHWTSSWHYLDTGLLILALALAAWLAFHKRSRKGMFALGLASLAYFGFVRKGCVCPIGSIQNVTEAIASGGALPWMVGAFFVLPLLFVIFFGRVFCAGVCPLGAIQDLFVWRRGVQVPRWLEAGIGLLAYLYLGMAVMYAACGGTYIICQYDPFVPLFRLNGPGYMLLIGAFFLALGLFIGRPYCRFLCPYGVLLRMLSPFSRKRVSITPAECIDCRLCEKSCPFGAIRQPTHYHRPVAALFGKKLLITQIALAPLLTATLAFGGYLIGDGFSSLHRDVALATQVAANQKRKIEKPSDELKNFIASGNSPSELYQQVAIIRAKFRIGSACVGAWMGIVIAWKLIAHTIRRTRKDYTADAGMCLACARCYDCCPVELKRRGVIMELPVTTPQPQPSINVSDNWSSQPHAQAQELSK